VIEETKEEDSLKFFTGKRPDTSVKVTNNKGEISFKERNHKMMSYRDNLDPEN